jgi:hypothetical protein
MSHDGAPVARPGRVELQDIAAGIVANLKTRYVNSYGLVSRDYPPSARNLLTDFDDYAPFLLWLGEKDFVLEQVRLADESLYQGLVCEDGRVVSWQNDEYLGGLVASYARTGDALCEERIRHALAGLGLLLVRDGYLCCYHSVRLGYTPPIVDPRSGALLEANEVQGSAGWAGQSCPVSGDDVEAALAWLDRLVGLKQGILGGLFPSKFYVGKRWLNAVCRRCPLPTPRHKLYPFVRGWRAPLGDMLYSLPFTVEAELAKHNTNLVHCLITAYRCTRRSEYKVAVLDWVAAVENAVVGSDGGAATLYSHGRPRGGIRLNNNFPLIEVLFPTQPDSQFDHLDDQTDMCVELTRLFELTGDEGYRDLASSTLGAVLQEHRHEAGYCLSVDGWGGVVDDTISPKFNALLLKSVVLAMCGEPVYGGGAIHSLMKDR